MKKLLFAVALVLYLAVEVYATEPTFTTWLPQNGEDQKLVWQKILKVIQPPANAFAITTSDTLALTAPVRAIYVGVSGDVKVDMVTGGTGIVFKAVPVGVFQIQAVKVYATLTTATNLIGLY